MNASDPTARRFIRAFVIAFCGVVGAVAVFGEAIRPAYADSTVGDGSPESCSDAALTAAVAGGGTIRFNCGTAPKVIVVTTPKTIALDTTLEGDGLILLSGDDKTSIFVVSIGKSLTLNAITLTNGDSGIADGGAIHNAGGHVTLNGSSIQASRTQSWGGALASHGGTVTLENSVVRGNNATRGAIYISGTLTVISSTIAYNTATEAGGGVYLDGSAAIRNSSIEGNRVEVGDGGGIFVSRSGIVSVTGGNITLNTAVADNRYGGGVATSGRATLFGVTVDGNYAYAAGGIWNKGGSLEVGSGRLERNQAVFAAGLLNDGGTANLTAVTIDSNAAVVAGGGVASYGGSTTITAATISNNQTGGDATPGGGGGILNQLGEVTLTNSTVSGNVAGSGGGILSLGGTTTLGNVTVADNSGGAGGVDIYRNDGLVVIRNTIVAGQQRRLRGPEAARSIVTSYNDHTPSQTSNCFGAITSLGYNLSDDGSCGLNAAGDQENEPALIDPLAENGGPTLTQMLQPDSPARDSGAPTGCPEHDQRGEDRPFGSACDKGSVEYDLESTPTATLRPPTATQSPTSPSATVTEPTPPTGTTPVTATPTSTGEAPSPTPTSIDGSPSETPTPTQTTTVDEHTPEPSLTPSGTPGPYWLYLPTLRRGVR